MDTVFRLKRRRREEPSDSLLITCKRSKKNDEETSEGPITAVLKLAATVDKQEDNVKEHITERLKKEDLKANFKQHAVDIQKKSREKFKEKICENRLKVVNSKRDIVQENVKIIDIADPSMSKADDDDYVYDLYFSNSSKDLPLDDLETIETINDELVFEDYYKKDEDEDSEDSNAESNWRNDYPDSEHSDDSIGEEDIRNALKNMNMDDELSTSDEDFVYGLDKDDVERYGHKYAKYKARIKKEIEGHCDSDSEEEEDDYDDDEAEEDHENYD